MPGIGLDLFSVQWEESKIDLLHNMLLFIYHIVFSFLIKIVLKLIIFNKKIIVLNINKMFLFFYGGNEMFSVNHLYPLF